MIKISKLEVLNEVVQALIASEYSISVEIIYDEYFEYEIDHYEINIWKVKK